MTTLYFRGGARRSKTVQQRGHVWSGMVDFSLSGHCLLCKKVMTCAYFEQNRTEPCPGRPEN